MFNYETEPVMRLSRLMVDADEEAASQSRSLVTNTLKHHQDIVDNQRQRQAANEELRIQRQIQAAEAAAEEEERQRNEEERAAEEDRNQSIEMVDTLRRDLKLNHDRASRLLKQNGELERSLPGSTSSAATVSRVTGNRRE